MKSKVRGNFLNNNALGQESFWGSRGMKNMNTCVYSEKLAKFQKNC